MVLPARELTVIKRDAKTIRELWQAAANQLVAQSFSNESVALGQ